MFPEIKATEVIIVILCILAVVASIFGSGVYVGSNHVQKKFDDYKNTQQEAVDQDRENRQSKADDLDEAGLKQLQDNMVENEKLKEELNEERAKNSVYTDCIVPDSGVQNYRNRVRSQ